MPHPNDVAKMSNLGALLADGMSEDLGDTLQARIAELEASVDAAYRELADGTEQLVDRMRRRLEAIELERAALQSAILTVDARRPSRNPEINGLRNIVESMNRGGLDADGEGATPNRCAPMPGYRSAQDLYRDWTGE